MEMRAISLANEKCPNVNTCAAKIYVRTRYTYDCEKDHLDDKDSSMNRRLVLYTYNRMLLIAGTTFTNWQLHRSSQLWPMEMGMQVPGRVMSRKR